MRTHPHSSSSLSSRETWWRGNDTEGTTSLEWAKSIQYMHTQGDIQCQADHCSPSNSKSILLHCRSVCINSSLQLKALFTKSNFDPSSCAHFFWQDHLPAGIEAGSVPVCFQTWFPSSSAFIWKTHSSPPLCQRWGPGEKGPEGHALHRCACSFLTRGTVNR